MDLGCLDMGCIALSDKQRRNDTTAQSEARDSEVRESPSGASNAGKNKASRETAQSNVLNKFTSQIKKSSHRKSSSPLNWFPRKKVDSYLKRKIKLLQEVDGMNSTLDETLGASNPHYCRVEREKMAAREAAQKTMEARKAAMVEASWFRILRAARIESKEAETLLMKAEENVGELFEAATAMGILMYDNPDCPRKSYEIETSSSNGGASTTHTVRASFETAFEVDKEVAAAVKTAFIRLANCSSFNKEEFRDLLRKIDQNPDDGKIYQDLSGVSSESDDESENQKPVLNPNGNTSPTGKLQKKCKKRHSTNKSSMENLVDMMIERLKCLKEEELASLAIIVATCGLNAALSEVENSKQCNSALNFVAPGGSELPSLDKFLIKNISKLEREVEEAKKRSKNENGEDLITDSNEKVEVENSFPDLGNVLVKNYTKFENEIEGGKTRQNGFPDLGNVLVKNYTKFENEIEGGKTGLNGESYEMGWKKLGRIEQELPSLEKYLVKHMSRLEKEVQGAKDRRENAISSSLDGNLAGKENIDLNKNVERLSKLEQEDSTNLSKQDSDNGSKKMENSLENILVKPALLLGKGKLKGENSESYEMCGKKLGRIEEDLPSLDNFLVKHFSKLEREVEEAKNRREIVTSSCLDGNTVGKVNIDLKTNVDRRSTLEVDESTNLSKQCGNYEGREMENSRGNLLVKPLHRLEREKMLKKRGENSGIECEGLDKVLVKHLSRLEKEKLASESLEIVKKKDLKADTQERNECGLDQVLVKHKCRLEREKLAASLQSEDEIKHTTNSRREVREKELQEAWGGLSLENSMRPPLSTKLAASLQSQDEIKHTTNSRREVRERELQEAWGGLSLGNSMRPHLSRLQRDKAAWLKAEEEERRRGHKEAALK